MNAVKRIVSILSYVIRLMILTYLVIWIPTLFSYRPVPILTGHMEPVYKRGSIVFCKKTPLKELKIGDIISYKDEKNEYTSQRISSIKGNIIETRGENIQKDNLSSVEYKNIIGKNGKIMIRYLGYFLSFMNHNVILFAIISVIVLVSNYYLSKKTSNDRELDKEEKKESEEIEVI